MDSSLKTVDGRVVCRTTSTSIRLRTETTPGSGTTITLTNVEAQWLAATLELAAKEVKGGS